MSKILLTTVLVLLVLGAIATLYARSLKTSNEQLTVQTIKTETINTPTDVLVPEANISTSSVAGMNIYTDTDFGFSFAYPSTWQVKEVKPTNMTEIGDLDNKYAEAMGIPGGKIKKKLVVTDGSKRIFIEEVVSPEFSIVDSSGVGACPVCNVMHYYFDTKQKIWMLEYPYPSDGVPEGPRPADISHTTMGGLPLFYGSQRFGANVIIPITHSNFVVVTVDGALATGNSDAQALAKTVMATDASAGVRVSAAEQIKIIQAEKEAYAK